jgi:hypothetical protein
LGNPHALNGLPPLLQKYTGVDIAGVPRCELHIRRSAFSLPPYLLASLLPSIQPKHSIITVK